MAEYVSPRGRNGLSKANTFASFAQEHGWTTKVSTPHEDEVKLFARRGDAEALNFYWINGCWSGESFYALAGERIKCHNLSAASTIVQGKPDPERMKKARRKLKLQAGVESAAGPISEADIAKLRSSLPFDEHSSDEEIEAVLHRKRVTWISTLSGLIDSAQVNADNQFQIVRKNGNDKIKADYISFSTARGYRAVYLHSILAVA